MIPDNVAQKPKGYLKSTIAMRQHSKNRMNKELLRYSLAQPKGTRQSSGNNQLVSVDQSLRTNQYYGPAGQASSRDRSGQMQPMLPTVGQMQRASTAGALGANGQRPRYG